MSAYVFDSDAAAGVALAPPTDTYFAIEFTFFIHFLVGACSNALSVFFAFSFGSQRR